MNIKLRTGTKDNFEEYYFKAMIISFFENTLKNVRKQNGIKLVTSIKKTSYFLSEPNYDTS